MSLKLVKASSWNYQVVYFILLGWFLAQINSSSNYISIALGVYLCDLLYVVDALAGKLSQFPCGHLLCRSKFGRRDEKEYFILLTNLLSLIPYHALVLLRRESPQIYFLVCLFRFGRLYRQGRLSAKLDFWHRT